MIEIIEERKEPDLSTEEKKVSEEITDALKEAAESEAKAADGNEEKSQEPEAAVAEEKAESAEGAEKAPESGESTAKAEAEETTEADEKAEASEEPDETEHKDTTEETENGDKEPDMLFGSRKLKKEIEKKDELIKEQNEKYIRLMAEFDNYRKRTEKEKAGMYAMGAKDVVEKILPVVDNFERGFSLVAEEDAEDPFTEGMQKIYKQLMTTLTDLGVTPIEAVGKEFDPNLHNAVMHVDDDSVGENIVVQEFQKGYMYKDSVVRHSMVQVAN
jgi:molecular chaperone GrpE